MHTIERSQVIGLSVERAFEFFSDPRNLPRITPPWLGFTVLESPERLSTGCQMSYTIRWLGLPLRWTTEIVDYVPGERFTDRQKRGPYRSWWHEHHFTALGNETLMRDRIEYELPLGLLGALMHTLVVRRQLRQILDYRFDVAERMFPATNVLPAAE